MLQLEENGVFPEVQDEDVSEIVSDTVIRYLMSIQFR